MLTKMFDASTKIPEGILYGSSHNLGNFDECINVAVNVPGEINSEPDVLKGQYCLAKVYLSGIENQNEKEESYSPHSAWGTLKVPTSRREFRKDVIYWTFCIPSACTNEDIEEFLNIVGDALGVRGLQLKFEVPRDMCQVKRELELDGYDIALAIVVAGFVVIITISTAYDLIVVQRSPNEYKTFKTNILICFSAYTNFVKLSAYTPSIYNLDSIFGIKAITMILILMGHASAFIFGGPSMNSNFKEEAVLKIENGILLNNPLLVDTFLMIGAFLLCRLLLVELEKRKFVNPLIVYLARIIRLTPAYAVVIAIYCTWFYKFDSGPMWESRIGLERDRCRKSWWANVLYVNNYVSNEYLCMFQSWYLAVDTQFFFLAPGIIYPLYKWPLVGEIILFGATLVSIIIPFVVTFVNHLDPVLMMYASEITDLASNPMYRTTYIKTHMRGMSYTIGLFLGYIIHKIQSSGYKVPKKILWCGWIIGTFFAISSMFTVSVFYYRPYDPFESAFYAALHRVGWCIGIAWVIFACITHNAGKLNKFLSLRLWVPISRLSYCAYLVNGLVELHTIGTLRHTRYLTNIEMAKETMSHIMLTYALALLFSILFEAPILSIESILLKKATHTTSKPMGSSTVSVESQSSVETTTSNSIA
ncbi:hypothetical protein RUM44_007953 [Polyplax serrata]|uniref:Nose resistant-to-fluoxetine protein N-terminal domain-containing protein n=1 Tax=Polyplax serrata TaxID=468196 RepID=A0ABR1B7G9_POLSC